MSLKILKLATWKAVTTLKGRVKALEEMIENIGGGGGGVGGRREHLSSVPEGGYASWLLDSEEILLAVDTYPALWVLRVSTLIPMRVRLYGSEAEALDDQSRPTGTTVPKGAGCFLDVQTTLAKPTVNLSPVPLAFNTEDIEENPTQNRLWLLIQNTSGADDYGSVNFVILPAERRMAAST